MIGRSKIFLLAVLTLLKARLDKWQNDSKLRLTYVLTAPRRKWAFEWYRIALLAHQARSWS